MGSANSLLVGGSLVPRGQRRASLVLNDLTPEETKSRLLSACLAWIIILVGVLVLMVCISKGFTENTGWNKCFGQDCQEDEMTGHEGPVVNSKDAKTSDQVTHYQTMMQEFRTSSTGDISSSVYTTKTSKAPALITPTPKMSQMQASEGHERVRRALKEDEFKAYYACIRLKNARVFKRSPSPIEALLFQQGQSATLSCNLCTRPDQPIDQQNIEWRHKLLSDGGREKAVIPDDERLLLTPDKSLVLSLLGVGDTGYYTCYRQGQYEALYHLDVVRKEPIIVVYESGKGPRPVQDVMLAKRNLNVYTAWSAWGPCSKCDKPGDRRRMGLCKVKKLKDGPIMPRDIPGLSHYEGGLPCRSNLLPRPLAQMPLLLQHPSQKEVGFCNNPCPTLPPYRLVRDENGEVVEIVETGTGFMSMREGRPTFPPLAKRNNIYREFDKPAILRCPHKDSMVVEIRWQNSTRHIDTSNVYRQTRGRVEIDINNNLVIKRLKFWDTATYSCWVKEKLVAVYKVRVIEEKRRNMKDYVVFAGFGLVALVSIMIACNVAKLQKKRGRSMK